jgi:3-oxoacyl-[acyl-carrier protein] reductase
MNIRFDGRVVLVSGAAQGIGRAIAEAFAESGAKVHIADRDPGVDATGKELGMRAHVVDLSDKQAAAGVIETIEAEEGRIDVLALSAGGVAGQAGTTLENITDTGWDRLMDANVKSALWLAQAAGPKMASRGWGRIIIISSGAGIRASLTGLHGYTAAKHAVIGLMKQLSVGLAGDGVTVNSIAPGFLLTNPDSQNQWDGWGAERQARTLSRISTGRLGLAEDIANPVLFLASEQASWITGQVLSVDGGVA